MNSPENFAAAAVASLGADLQRVAGVVAELGDRVVQLENVSGAAAGGAGSAGGLRPVCWPSLTAEQAAAAWDELGEWVARVAMPTLSPTLRQVPGCWPMHVWGRETWSWLHAAHRQAYGPHGSGFQAAEWHTRWVPHAYAAFDGKDAARGGFCDRPEHRAAGADPGRVLRVEDWSLWFDRARAEDLGRRQQEETESSTGG